jgi:glycosyltransferase involved in cell wall biosynthesis
MSSLPPAGQDGAAAGEVRPTVVVYTLSVLEPSMTFIQSHAEALRTYQPVFAGAHRVPGLPLPEDRVVTANRGGLAGRAEEFLFRRLHFAGRLARDLRRFEPAVVHAHFGQSGPSALALAESLQVPLVVTFHGQDATISDHELRGSWRGREYLRGRQRVIRGAGLIIAVSDFIRQRLLAGGYPEEKVVTHRNGIDISFFHRREAQREPVALFVGRFVEKKGCEYLVRALGQLSESNRPVQGVFVGDGPLRPKLEELSARVGANIRFTGFRPLPEVRDWLGRASVVVVPSVTAANGDSEGLPTVILEAQAMGTPVVVTRHAGNAEGVLEGRSAIVVAERDVPGLADAVRFFVDQPAAIETFGTAGRAFVAATFDIARQAQGLEQLYDRVRHRVQTGQAATCPA